MRKKFFAPVIIILLAGAAWAQTPADRETAYRANNRGVALLEQYKYKDGAEEFRRALAIAPDMFLARLNLAIALVNAPDLPAAKQEAEAALKLKPDAPPALYVLGLVAKSESRAADALALFQRVLALDPDDPGANINAGQLLAQQRQYAEAAALFRRAVASEPYNTSALYGLGQALLRSNAREEGQAVMQQFQKFRANGAGTTLSNNYLEQGRYAEAIASTGAENDLVDKSAPKVRFVDATKFSFPLRHKGKTIRNKAFRTAQEAFTNSFPGGVTLFDFDGDGDLDVLDVNLFFLQLWRNDAGKFVDVTDIAGLPRKLPGRDGGTVAGDYDNDLRPDLLILNSDGCLLFHNEGNGKFTDKTRAAGLPKIGFDPMTGAFVDIDHDGDLEIFLAGASTLLLRNDGTGKFKDETAASKITAPANRKVVAVVPTDYDNRRDVDLLLLPTAGYSLTNSMNTPVLYQNQRDTSFRDVTAEVGLLETGDYTCVAAGDFNKDSFPDFFFGRRQISQLRYTDGPLTDFLKRSEEYNKVASGVFAQSDGKGHFKLSNAPIVATQAQAAQFLDYDNDGLLDLVLINQHGLRVLRNIGSAWQDVSNGVVAAELQNFAASYPVMAAGDIDGDGDEDLLMRSSLGELRFVRNEGGNANNSVRVNVKGLVGNRSGIGAKVDIRAGSLGQKLEYYSASPAPAPSDLVFGLGKRAAADAVRIVWPSGIVQAEIAGLDTLARKPLTVTELDLKPSSCPYLYAWNGERFEFITDFMGGGEMGYWEAPGLYNHPDPDEYVRITDRQLKPVNGRYEIRVTNELEEVLFVDHLKLIAVAHPSDTEIYPDEGMGHAPYPAPLKVFQTTNAQPPLAAVDDTGADVLPQLREIDHKYPSNFALDKVRGYAGEHTLTLQLPVKATQMPDAKEQTLLLLNGWTDYAFSSDNVAAAQAAKTMKPPALQVKDKAGNWQTVIPDIGIPIGRPQTVTVDLTGKFLSDSREVRIITNMRVYYDQILVGMRNAECGMRNCADSTQITELTPVVADLHWRGYSAEVRTGGREQPLNYDYAQVRWAGPWKTAPGRYTREGDVNELLEKADDNFVISRTGDELRLSFDAKQLPALPAGWKRTFLLYGDGFSKELDINSATPHAVGPLPFHGMTKYPYEWPETYPLTPEREALMERYNTRAVRTELSSLAFVGELK